MIVDMEITILKDIFIIFGVSLAVLFLFHRIRIPAILGFLLTGIVLGPHGFHLIKSAEEVKILAEIGIMLLLFTIGIEFSLKNLMRIKRSVLLGGTLQVALTLLAGLLWARQTGLPLRESIFMGFLISLSSTAIVLKLIQERGEVDSPHGQTSLAILIFQDIIIVPMMLFIPFLAGQSQNLEGSVVSLLAKGILIILLVVISARWIVPAILFQVARTKIRELFLISIFFICLGTVWLTSSAGLSLALGAFIAGLVISESEYSHQTLGNVLPFRDVFTSFFFVSIGMLFDYHFLFEKLFLIIFITAGVLVLKSIIASCVSILLGYPLRSALLTGLAISQIGEFSFILSQKGLEYGFLSGDYYQLFLATSILTMAATPFLISLSPGIADLVLKLPFPKRLKSGLSRIPERAQTKEKDHIIIIGFGIIGKSIARAANVAGIPHLIIEMNPDTVRKARSSGIPIFYGDATQEAVLQHANARSARIVVVAINDPTATRRITELLHRLNPRAYIIVRTRYLQDMQALLKLGANEVVPEEFETSVEIFTRVLMKYLVPKNEIDAFVAQIRSDGYEMFRSAAGKFLSFPELEFNFQNMEIAALRVNESCSMAGKSLTQLELRKKYGVTLLAMRRGSETISTPGGETVIQGNDILVVLGPPDKVSIFARILAACM